MRLKLFILFFSFCVPAWTQTGFQKYFSEPIEYQQFRYSAYDSSYVIAGSRFVTGTVYDFCAMKIDREGTLLWSRYYPSPNDEFLSALSVSPSGEISMAGYKSGTTTSNDFSFLKTDASGNLLWHKTYGNTNTELSVYAGENSSGDYFMAGNREGGNDPMAVKLNNSGTLLWSKTFGTTAATEHADVAGVTADGGIVMAGELSGPNTFLMKLSSGGTTEWAHSYSSLHTQFFASLIQTGDKGFIYASTDYRCDSWGCFPFFSFIKLDSSGNVSWSKAVEGFYGWGRSAIETSDGGFAITGQIQDTAGGDKNPVLIKTDAAGNLQWARSYGKPGLVGETYFLEEDPAGGYALFGLVNSGAHLIKTDVSGFSGCYEKTITPVLSNMNFARSGTTVLPEKTIVDFIVQPSIAGSPFAVTDSFVCITLGVNDIQLSIDCKIYPNPFSETAVVEIEGLQGAMEMQFLLYDVFGRVVLQSRISNSKTVIARTGVTAGVYFYKLIYKDSAAAHGKVIVR